MNLKPKGYIKVDEKMWSQHLYLYAVLIYLQYVLCMYVLGFSWGNISKEIYVCIHLDYKKTQNLLQDAWAPAFTHFTFSSFAWGLKATRWEPENTSPDVNHFPTCHRLLAAQRELGRSWCDLVTTAMESVQKRASYRQNKRPVGAVRTQSTEPCSVLYCTACGGVGAFLRRCPVDKIYTFIK